MANIKTPKIILDFDGTELKCKFSGYASNGTSTFEVTKPSQSGKVNLSAFINEKDVDFSCKIPKSTKKIFSEKSSNDILNAVSARDKEKRESKKASKTTTTSSGSKSGKTSSKSSTTKKKSSSLISLFED